MVQYCRLWRRLGTYLQGKELSSLHIYEYLVSRNNKIGFKRLPSRAALCSILGKNPKIFRKVVTEEGTPNLWTMADDWEMALS